MDDAELVDGLIRGEARYQLALLDRYQERLVEYLFRFHPLVENEAEEIAADVLEQLVLKPEIIDLSRGRGELDGLVFKMAKNRAIDLIRKTKSSLGGKRVISLDANSDMLERVSKNVSGSDGGSETALPTEVEIQAKQLLADLDLDEDQLEHLRLRTEEKLKPKEIARFLGITNGNERVRWHRLQKKIDREWRKYPHIVEYGKEIGALDPKEEVPDSSSETAAE